MFKRLFGIEITLGPSLLIPFAFVIGGSFLDFYATLFNVTCLIFLYVFVLAHELVHVYVAEKAGYVCEGVHIFMFGGVAKIGPDMIAGIRKHPIHETLIAVAGPAVSLIYAVVFGGMFYYNPNAGMAFATGIHVAILILNLLPIFPLDGGRVFRSLLAQMTSYRTATKIAGDVAFLGCTGLFIFGVLAGAWTLCIISIMLLFMSRSEVKVCLAHDRNVEILAGRKPIPSYDENPTLLGDKYMEFVTQGMEPREAFHRAFDWRFFGTGVTSKGRQHG